ncbi:MAG: endonuclease domain-containing protein [Bauldia sp.]
MPHREVPPANRAFGKTMRQAMTPAEARLWQWLRKPGIAGLRFRRQVPLGPYIVDFLCPQKALIVEVDGGHHASPGPGTRDARRDVWLSDQGYKVVRVWNSDVMTNIEGVCAAIVAAVAEGTRSRNR